MTRCAADNGEEEEEDHDDDDDNDKRYVESVSQNVMMACAFAAVMYGAEKSDTPTHTRTY